MKKVDRFLWHFLNNFEGNIFKRTLHDGKNIKSFSYIPGPLSLPGVGTLYQYLPLIGKYRFDRLHWNGLKKFNKFGPVVREEIMPGINIVWIFDPKDIETMFRSEGKYPKRRSHLALEKYRLDKPYVYNTGGLLPTNGPDWFKQRSVFQKGLSQPKSVQNFASDANDIVSEWLHRIQLISSNSKVDYLPELSRLFLELTCAAVFDIRLNSFSKRELNSNSRSSQLMKAALTTNSCILKTDNGLQLWKRFETPLYRKLRKSQTYMENIATDFVTLKMSLYEEKQKTCPKSLLETYLASPQLDFKDIVGITCDLLLAGIDTTSYSMCFVLHHLATNVDCQDKLYEECKLLLPSPFSRVCKHVLSEAKYAKAVLKESLRLRPVSVGVGRILAQSAVFSGYHVPEGTVVVSQNQVSCRLNNYIVQADRFIPERWLKNDKKYQAPHPFLVLPFGHGPRSCIARRLAEQNMLITIMRLIRTFRIEWKGKSIDTRSLLINQPDKPIHLLFSIRSNLH